MISSSAWTAEAIISPREKRDEALLIKSFRDERKVWRRSSHKAFLRAQAGAKNADKKESSPTRLLFGDGVASPTASDCCPSSSEEKKPTGQQLNDAHAIIKAASSCASSDVGEEEDSINSMVLFDEVVEHIPADIPMEIKVNSHHPKRFPSKNCHNSLSSIISKSSSSALFSPDSSSFSLHESCSSFASHGSCGSSNHKRINRRRRIGGSRPVIRVNPYAVSEDASGSTPTVKTTATLTKSPKQRRRSSMSSRGSRGSRRSRRGSKKPSSIEAPSPLLGSAGLVDEGEQGSPSSSNRLLFSKRRDPNYRTLNDFLACDSLERKTPKLISDESPPSITPAIIAVEAPEAVGIPEEPSFREQLLSRFAISDTYLVLSDEEAED